MAVHTFSLCFGSTDQWDSGQQCMEVRKAITPDWNVTRMKRKLTMTMFWRMTIESKLLKQFQWSWYHSFQKTVFYLMKSKYAIFSNIKVTTIERSAFWGDTRNTDRKSGMVMPFLWWRREKERKSNRQIHIPPPLYSLTHKQTHSHTLRCTYEYIHTHTWIQHMHTHTNSNRYTDTHAVTHLLRHEQEKNI